MTDRPIPKPFAAIAKNAERKHISTAYTETTTGAWACDNTRLYVAGAPELPPKYARIIPTASPVSWEIDKPLLAFLKLCAKLKTGGKRSATYPLRLNGHYELRGGHHFDNVSHAHFDRKPPISLPDDMGVDPAYLMDALKFVVGGKPGSVSIAYAGGKSPLAIRNGDRLAVIVPILTKQ
jgi:hypothetical protein